VPAHNVPQTVLGAGSSDRFGGERDDDEEKNDEEPLEESPHSAENYHSHKHIDAQSYPWYNGDIQDNDTRHRRLEFSKRQAHEYYQFGYLYIKYIQFVQIIIYIHW
jgi:hypothetical protein